MRYWSALQVDSAVAAAHIAVYLYPGVSTATDCRRMLSESTHDGGVFCPDASLCGVQLLPSAVNGAGFLSGNSCSLLAPSESSCSALDESLRSQDVDECASRGLLSPGCTQGGCTNLIGGYTCGYCRPGYHSDLKRQSCQDFRRESIETDLLIPWNYGALISGASDGTCDRLFPHSVLPVMDKKQQLQLLKFYRDSEPGNHVKKWHWTGWRVVQSQSVYTYLGRNYSLGEVSTILNVAPEKVTPHDPAYGVDSTDEFRLAFYMTLNADGTVTMYFSEAHAYKNSAAFFCVNKD